jgi:predicted ester cyclase
MKTPMKRFPLRPAISNPSSMNIKSLVFALIAGAVIGITAGCGKGKETPVGTNAVPTAEQRRTDAVPDGHWEADITGDGPQRIRVTLDLAKNAKSEWIASMGVPSANKTGMVVKDVAVNGKSVKFVAVEFMMAAFDLTLGPDGSMKGMISSPGSQPVEFKRTGEAKVELPPTSPAVSKELEGDWEGLIAMPNGSARVVFHFKNQPDKTVTATVDDDNRVGMPISNVKQTGQKVEFAVEVEHCTFQGSLNKEGTELAGQLIVGPTPTPLTLRKKSGQPPK